MTQENDIRLAYINTLLDGGYTRLLENASSISFAILGAENPTIGYIVGGVTKGSTMDVPTLDFNDSRELDSYAEFKELWCKYAEKAPLYNDYNGHRLSGVGTWIHEGKIYFDLVQHFHGIDRATQQAKLRGEIAIYDCKNQKDILL